MLNFENNISTIWLSLSIIITINNKFTSCYLIVLLRQISSLTSNFIKYDNLHQYTKFSSRKKNLSDIVVPAKSKFMNISCLFSIILSIILLLVITNNMLHDKYDLLLFYFLFSFIILFTNSTKMLCVTLLKAFEKISFSNYINAIHAITTFCVLFIVCKLHGKLFEIIVSVAFLNIIFLILFSYKVEQYIGIKIFKEILFKRTLNSKNKDLNKPIIKNIISTLSFLTIIQGSGILFSIFANSESSSLYLISLKAFEAINKFAYIPISTRFQYVTRCIKEKSFDVLNFFLCPRFILNNILTLIGFILFYFIILNYKAEGILNENNELLKITILFILLSFVTKSYAIVLMLQNSLNRMLFYKNYIYALIVFLTCFISFIDQISIILLVTSQIFSFLVAFRFNIILNTCERFKINTKKLFSVQLLAIPLLLTIYFYYD